MESFLSTISLRESLILDEQEQKSILGGTGEDPAQPPPDLPMI